ncbi:hypothetical protein FHR55_002773 [Xanthomonas arboricola]
MTSRLFFGVSPQRDAGRMHDAHLQGAGLQGQQLRAWQDPTDMQTLQ